MSQKVPVNGFKWVKKLSKFDECFIKNDDENSNKRYILEVHAEYPKNLFNLHKGLLFLAEKKKIGKCKKLVCNIHHKESYVRVFKQALNHELIQKNVHKVIKFNQEAWLKPYNDMNSKNRCKKLL